MQVREREKEINSRLVCVCAAAAAAKNRARIYAMSAINERDSARHADVALD